MTMEDMEEAGRSRDYY